MARDAQINEMRPELGAATWMAVRDAKKQNADQEDEQILDDLMTAAVFAQESKSEDREKHHRRIRMLRLEILRRMWEGK